MHRRRGHCEVSQAARDDLPVADQRGLVDAERVDMIVGGRVEEHVKADDVRVRIPAHPGEVGEIGDPFDQIIHVVAAKGPTRGRVGSVGDGKIKLRGADSGELEI